MTTNVNAVLKGGAIGRATDAIKGVGEALDALKTCLAPHRKGRSWLRGLLGSGPDPDMADRMSEAARFLRGRCLVLEVALLDDPGPAVTAAGRACIGRALQAAEAAERLADTLAQSPSPAP